MDYVRTKSASSGIAKAALALGITGTGLNLLNGGTGVPGLLGGQRYAAPPAAFGLEQAFYGGAHGYGYVTEKEMRLTREISEKDSTIAQLGAERYADAAVKAATDPLNVRICNLETAEAVNAARDQDFRRYVNAEFVHQPKASIRESIVVCKQCGCECERECC